MLHNALKTTLFNIDLILEKAQLKGGDYVADLGSGQLGYFSLASAKKVGKYGKVYAVDIMKKNLEMLQKQATTNNLTNLITVWGDLEIPNATKIDNNSLDIAFLINILSQTKEPLQIIKESFRMLKANGRLIIVDWKKIASPLGPKKDKKINQESLITETEKTGFYLQEKFEAGKYHFGIIFKKP